MKPQKKTALLNQKKMKMMKSKIKVTKQLFAIGLVVLFGLSISTIEAQTKKLKPRFSVEFFNDGSSQVLNISGKYKEKRKFKMASGLNLKVYTLSETDSLISIGQGKLNQSGKLKFDVAPVFNNPQEDYRFKVVFAGNDKFKKSTKSISVKPASLKSKLIENENHYSIQATLTDMNDNPIEGQELKVQLQRLFAPLPVDNEIHFTDENGMIVVPITSKMPGIDGELQYEVVLNESDDYGTIKSVINAKIGSEIKDLSTFDERTMWSPPSKAPWVDLIVPNLLIIGIWGTLIILVINLFKISKNKH